MGGGYRNIASGTYATVCGGRRNRVTESVATVVGRYRNSAAEYASVIVGGEFDTLTVDADFSMAFGESVYVADSHYVVFFDSANAGHFWLNRDRHDATSSTHPIIVGTNTSNGNGVFLSAGGNWTSTSSRVLKENFEELNGSEVLNKIENMSVTHYQFKGSGERHVGPVVEDFYHAFECGSGNPADDSTHISAADMAGVSLRAIQELTSIIKEQQQEIDALKAEVSALKGE